MANLKHWRWGELIDTYAAVGFSMKMLDSVDVQSRSEFYYWLDEYKKIMRILSVIEKEIRRRREMVGAS